LFIKNAGHAGSLTAEYVSVELKACIERTPQWVQYSKLSAQKRAHSTDLLSQALVQAYVDMDEALLELEDGGILVREQGREGVSLSVCVYTSCACVYLSLLGQLRVHLLCTDVYLGVSQIIAIACCLCLRVVVAYRIFRIFFL
jgi:hypothetical protein